VRELINHPLFALTGWIIGLAGLVATLVAIRRKRLCYVTVENGIVSEASSAISELRVYYGKKQIERLYACVVTVWNRGTAVITQNDVAKGAPLQISLNGPGEILGCFLDGQSRPGNAFRLKRSPAPNTYDLGFDYLAQGNGCRVVVLHTCTELHRVLVRGEIIDGAEIEFQRDPTFNSLLVILLVALSMSGSVGLGTVWARHEVDVARASQLVEKANMLAARANVMTTITPVIVCAVLTVAVSLYLRGRWSRPRIG
jgi:hypothetical protein